MWLKQRSSWVLGVALPLVLTGVGGGFYWQSASEPEACVCDPPVVAGPPIAQPSATEPAEPALEILARPPAIPDESLVNQRGESVRFYADLVKDKVVAIQFIFTTCQGVCPPLGASFGSLQKSAPGVQLVSVSVDPLTDTPERLEAWGQRFGAGPNWTQVTGPKASIDRLLKALRSDTPDKNGHTPLFLVGNARTGRWRRVHGLAAPEKIARILKGLETETGSASESASASVPAPLPPPRVEPSLAAIPGAEAATSPGLRYFTDTPLLDQNGQAHRLYDDLLRDRVVVLNFFFTSCKGSCPVLMAKFQQVQRHFKDRLGKDLVLISISVDPNRDDRPRLSEYAGKLGAQPGWYLMTAKPDDLKFILSRFGQTLGEPDQHTNLFMVGNERTKLWKKLNGLATAEELIPLIEEVLEDQENAPGTTKAADLRPPAPPSGS